MANLGVFNISQPLNPYTSPTTSVNPFAPTMQSNISQGTTGVGVTPTGPVSPYDINVTSTTGIDPRGPNFEPCPPGFFRPCPTCPCTSGHPGDPDPFPGAGLTTDRPYTFEPIPPTEQTGVVQGPIRTVDRPKGQTSGVGGLSAGRPMDLQGVFGRQGGGQGGGAQEDLEYYENPMLAMGSPLLGRNVTAFKHGGNMESLKNLGRYGDTELAHVTPEEKEMLEARGGAGTINPYTGLREYHKSFWQGHPFHHWDYGGTASAPWYLKPFVAVMDTISNVGKTLEFNPDAWEPKVLQHNPKTGKYEMDVGEGQRFSYDDQYLYHLSDKEGDVGTLTGQAIKGDPWSVAPRQFLPPVERSPRDIQAEIKRRKKSKVVNPFNPNAPRSGSEAEGTEKYRWDLQNPLIRENVDIFRGGGKMHYYNQGGKNPYTYDNGGNWTNLAQEMKQAAMGSFEKGVAARQIRDVLQMRAKRKNKRFTKGGKF